MQRALDTIVPGFQLWDSTAYAPEVLHYYRPTRRQQPWAVIGDFNGDGIRDIMLDGHVGRRALLVALVSQSSRFRTVLVDSNFAERAGQRINYLEYKAPGRYGTNYNGEHFVLRRDGVECIIFDKAADLLYWVRDHFERFSTAD